MLDIYHCDTRLKNCYMHAYYLPCDEENLAFLAVLFGNEIEIVDSITTLIRWKTGGEIIVTVIRFPELINHNLLLLNLEQNETIAPLCL